MCVRECVRACAPAYVCVRARARARVCVCVCVRVRVCARASERSFGVQIEASGVSNQTFGYMYGRNLMDMAYLGFTHNVSVTYMDLWCP